MSQTATDLAQIPAPPAPGSAEVLDEVLVGLAAPPRTRRRVLTALLTGVSVASLFLASQLVDDVQYAMARERPTLLGDARTADLSPSSVAPNQYVTVQAVPSTAGAVRYSRLLWPGDHVVFPVAGRDGQPLYVQVPADGSSFSRGTYTGRLIPFGGAGGRYRGVGSYLHSAMNPRVHNNTWLLVDGAAPRANLWAPFAATLLLALALTDLALLARLLRPSKD